MEDTIWRPLRDLEQRVGPHVEPPTEIRFPDGETMYMIHWKDVFEHVTRWLYENNHLRSRFCPVGLPNATKRLVVNRRPRHKDGSRFEEVRRVGPLYIETKDTGSQLLKKAVFLIEQFAPDLADEFCY